MVEGLKGLVELARIDTEIATRVSRKDALPAKRRKCEERRRTSADRIVTARAATESVELAQRQHEARARDQQALLEKLEGQQHQVKSNEAYTTLLHEMEVAKDAISEAETAVLESMEILDQGQADIASAERVHAEEVAATEAEETDLDASERALDAELEAYRSERAALSQTIDRATLTLYERVARRRIPAIAVVTNETCTGCSVGIPPQNYLEVRTAESLISCGQCNRILIHQVHLD